MTIRKRRSKPKNIWSIQCRNTGTFTQDANAHTSQASHPSCITTSSQERNGHRSEYDSPQCLLGLHSSPHTRALPPMPQQHGGVVCIQSLRCWAFLLNCTMVALYHYNHANADMYRHVKHTAQRNCNTQYFPTYHIATSYIHANIFVHDTMHSHTSSPLSPTPFEQILRQLRGFAWSSLSHDYCDALRFHHIEELPIDTVRMDLYQIYTCIISILSREFELSIADVQLFHYTTFAQHETGERTVVAWSTSFALGCIPPFLPLRALPTHAYTYITIHGIYYTHCI